MNQAQFIEAIIGTPNTDTERIGRYLQARGYPVVYDQANDSLMISDNAHNDDNSALSNMLTEYNIGFVSEKKILVHTPSNINKLANMFIAALPIPHEEVFLAIKSSKFRNYHSPKIPTVMLESYIARYIKALSACSISTVSSCDGNHERGNRMYITFTNYCFSDWHEYLWEKYLSSLFPDLLWRDHHTSIQFSKTNQFKTYLCLNTAAAYLYSNRMKLRDIKFTAAQAIPSRVWNANKDEAMNEYNKLAEEAGLREVFIGEHNSLSQGWNKVEYAF